MSAIYETALSRFQVDPSKAFQRHIRELSAELDPRAQLTSLDGARVEKITREDAKSIILRYEWLGTLGRGTRAFYGLRIGSDLLGAIVFGTGTSHAARNICGPEYIPQTVCLQRGACVHYAPKNAASFLIRHACRQAYQDHGWKVFFAYSDAQAGEVGTVYQAANWFYIGSGMGRSRGNAHTGWLTPNGTVVSSRNRALTKKQCLALGYTPILEKPKGRYVWFEGEEREELRAKCLYEFKPYPKRIVLCIQPVNL